MRGARAAWLGLLAVASATSVVLVGAPCAANTLEIVVTPRAPALAARLRAEFEALHVRVKTPRSDEGPNGPRLVVKRTRGRVVLRVLASSADAREDFLDGAVVGRNVEDAVVAARAVELVRASRFVDPAVTSEEHEPARSTLAPAVAPAAAAQAVSAVSPVDERSLPAARAADEPTAPVDAAPEEVAPRVNADAPAASGGERRIAAKRSARSVVSTEVGPGIIVSPSSFGATPGVALGVHVALGARVSVGGLAMVPVGSTEVLVPEGQVALAPGLGYAGVRVDLPWDALAATLSAELGGGVTIVYGRGQAAAPLVGREAVAVLPLAALRVGATFRVAGPVRLGAHVIAAAPFGGAAVFTGTTARARWGLPIIAPTLSAEVAF